MNFNRKKLQIIMAQKEIGIRDLALMANLSPATISKYVRGVSSPGLKSLGKVSNALGFDVTDLILEDLETKKE